MIYSMTGFARIIQIVDNNEHIIEIKTFNHKYIDIKLNLPKQLSQLEIEINELLKNKLLRGSIQVTYEIKSNNDNKNLEKILNLNFDLLKTYCDLLKKLATKLNVDYQPNIENIIKQFGLIDNNNYNFELKNEKILNLFVKAINKINIFRKNEGNKIAKILLNRLKTLKKLITQIEKYSLNVKTQYFNKLNERINTFFKNVNANYKLNEDRLIQEVAILVDKSDISEEIERFKMHINHFKELIKSKSEEIKGRKMDFLCQEMLREINTLSNKSNLSEIIKNTIEIKSEIEKIREQVQNVL